MHLKVGKNWIWNMFSSMFLALQQEMLWNHLTEKNVLLINFINQWSLVFLPSQHTGNFVWLVTFKSLKINFILIYGYKNEVKAQKTELRECRRSSETTIIENLSFDQRHGFLYFCLGNRSIEVSSTFLQENQNQAIIFDQIRRNI